MNTTDIQSKVQSFTASLNTPETMKVILIVALIISLAIVLFGLLFLYLLKKRGKKTLPGWICVGLGGVSVLSVGFQLLLYGV